jgi:hypothetical protein
MYQFAPTAMDGKNLSPGGGYVASAQNIADTLARASRWVDSVCFGASDSASMPSLAANLRVEDAQVRVKTGNLRLICDYRPIQQVIGIDVGLEPSSVQSIGPNIGASVRIGRRTIYVPLGGLLCRGGWVGAGSLYAVWSYVMGFPHTKLVASVTEGETTCQVQATDGAGGVWGALISPFFTVYDKTNTETVQVTSVSAPSPGSTVATLTTTPFQNAHDVPDAPDFIPFTTIPADVQQAAISMTTMLIKTRGGRGLVMPSTPGGSPSGPAAGQAGVMSDFKIAHGILREGGYIVRVKSKI